MKKMLAIAMAAAMAVGSLAGCGQKAPETKAPETQAPAAETPATEAPEAEAGEANEDIVATLSLWHGASDEVRQKAYDHAVEKFNQKYPNVTVEQLSLDSDSYKTKLKTAMGAGGQDVPDVFMNWGGGVLKSYVDEGLVIDITPYFEDYFDEYYDFEFGLSTFDGGVYGAGFGIAPASVFYNKEIFEDLGLEVPTTHEELDEVCAKLKDAGIIPFALGNKNRWPGLLEYTMLIADLGGQQGSVDMINRDLGFDNDVLVKAGEYLVDFSNKGYYPEGCNGIDHNTGGTRMMFYNELCGMFIMTGNFPSQCMSEDPEFYEKIGLFNYPATSDNAGGVVTGGNVFSISSTCEYPEVAAELVHCITDAETSSYSVSMGGAFSGAKGVDMSDPLIQEQFDMMMAAEWTQNFMDQQYVTEVGEAFKDATQAIYGGTMTPEDAAKAIEEAAVSAYGPVK